MNETFKKYVTNIVEQTDGSTEMKSDLFEELMTHLEESYEALMNDGVDQEEAEQEVLRTFGDATEIGQEIRQAMYPYQKELLFTLVIASFVYSFIVYLLQLFNEGDAHIWWLIMSVGISSIILLILSNIVQVEGKRWINTSLILHIVIYFFGLGLALGLDLFMVSILSIYCILIILLALILIYLNVIFHWEMSKLKKGFHIFNMSSGLLIIGANLFIIWAFLMFSEGFTGKSLLLFMPTVLWLLAYIIQMFFIRRESMRVATFIALIPALLAGGIIIFRVMIYTF